MKSYQRIPIPIFAIFLLFLNVIHCTKHKKEGKPVNFTLNTLDRSYQLQEGNGKIRLVYFGFLLMTKSKWYFSIPTLILLLIDQSIKFQIDFINSSDPKNKKVIQYEYIREIVYILIIMMIVVMDIMNLIKC